MLSISDIDEGSFMDVANVVKASMSFAAQHSVIL
jgi:hypothetical protein